MVGISNKLQGYAGTIIVHSIAILILFFLTFSASLPDSANEGLLINFGNSEDGFGNSEPKVNYDNAVMITLPTHIKAPKIDEKKILTQDFQDSPTIETKKKTTKKETKKEVTPTEVKKETKQTKQTDQKDLPKQTEEIKTTETVKEQVVNKKALFPGKSANGGTTGEGITGKEGNQGSLVGSPDSQNRIGGATGGNGSGEGNGKGISYNLDGRSALSLPPPNYPKQSGGIVVVRVTVDKRGNVTEVSTDGVKGSTTADEDLISEAKKAAKKAKFDVSQNAPPFQTGTITYVFKLQ